MILLKNDEVIIDFLTWPPTDFSAWSCGCSEAISSWNHCYIFCKFLVNPNEQTFPTIYCRYRNIVNFSHTSWIQKYTQKCHSNQWGENRQIPPLTLRGCGPQSNTPISRSTPLTTPNGIPIQHHRQMISVRSYRHWQRDSGYASRLGFNSASNITRPIYTQKLH